MQRQIGELLKGNAGLAEAHYLSYLNNLRINEFCNTIHELYRYSDKHAFSDNDNDSYATEIGHSFRYAALNLAGVHCRFGHIDEATAALREAITMAQEANDNVCLQHALGLLCRLQQERGDDSSYLLERSATRARELNLAYLTSLGIQNYIKEKCLSGADPASEMSRLCSQILLNMNHSYSSSLGRSSSPVDSEAVCVVLCHLSKLHAEQGYYNAALDVINYMKKTYPSHSQYSKLWMMVEQQISFTRAIHHAKWTAAEQAVLNIVSIDEVEALYRKCIVLRMKGETSEAYKLLNEMLIHCQHRKKGYTAEHHTR
uniref:Anaphase-promoting complex subunit 5 n=1 Tax=Saccoglossus kowalevskii TaxID=10224 RepID=A0ABM0LZU0_SACKO